MDGNDYLTAVVNIKQEKLESDDAEQSESSSAFSRETTLNERACLDERIYLPMDLAAGDSADVGFLVENMIIYKNKTADSERETTHADSEDASEQLVYSDTDNPIDQIERETTHEELVYCDTGIPIDKIERETTHTDKLGMRNGTVDSRTLSHKNERQSRRKGKPSRLRQNFISLPSEPKSWLTRDGPAKVPVLPEVNKTETTDKKAADVGKNSNESPGQQPRKRAKKQYIPRKDAEGNKILYPCEFCQKKFKTAKEIRRHTIAHTGVKPYVCDICDKGYTERRFMEMHQETHTGQYSHRCELCGKGFVRASLLKNHVMTHTGERPFPCTQCDQGFIKAAGLRDHMKKKHSDGPPPAPKTCEICGKQYTTIAGMQKHILMKHTNKRPFQCSMCGKCFATRFYLKTHENYTHSTEKPYECNICHVAFNRPTSLRSHMMTHTDKKPHVCTVCQKKFMHAESLKRHMRGHTGERPFECPFCDKNYAQSSCLRWHKMTHHQDQMRGGTFEEPELEVPYRTEDSVIPSMQMKTSNTAIRDTINVLLSQS